LGEFKLENQFIKKIEFFIKHNTFFQYTYRIVLSAFFRFLGIFVSCKRNTILFSSFSGKSFNDSPKAIYDELLKRKEFSDYDYVWAFEKPDLFTLPKGRKVQINSLKYFIIALGAKYWIANVNIERGLKFKKKTTRFLHTGHGTGPQLCGNAVKGRKFYDYSNVNFMCADGPFIKEVFVRDFKANPNNFLMCGRPREDELFSLSDEDKSRFKQQFKIPNDKKIILYAPTWRDDYYNPKNKDFNVIPINLQIWEKELSNDYVIIFRAHSQSIIKNKFSFNSFFTDGSNYPYINHQIAIADIVISDYSSLLWDAALIKKPIVSFAYDYDNYASTRGLYFDMRSEFPGGVVENEQQLIERILKFNFERETQHSIALKEKFITRDSSSATNTCIEALFSK
jgi:CDP-glycerol glycerophosphotransferase